MTHKCDAIVVNCIDFRFQKYIRDWIGTWLNGKTFDFVGFAGATKDLATIMGQIDISVKLHQITEVYLIHHEDCGAYGDQSTPDRHRQDLIKAKQAIQAKYPYLRIHMYYLHLDGRFEEITA